MQNGEKAVATATTKTIPATVPEKIDNTDLAPVNGSALDAVEGQKVTFHMPSTEELAKLSTLDEKFSMTARYRTQEEWAKLQDQPIRCFFIGIKQIPNDEGEMIGCAVFVSEREVFISGQMLLVDSVKRLCTNTPLVITYLGKKKNKNGKGATNLFEVVKLG